MAVVVKTNRKGQVLAVHDKQQVCLMVEQVLKEKEWMDRDEIVVDLQDYPSLDGPKMAVVIEKRKP